MHEQTGPRFPKPDPAGAYAEFKIYDTKGDPLRRPVEDWEGAKERVRSSRAAQTWLAERRADIDDWIAKRQDRPEWIAGWWHNFVSPKDGSFLIWTPDEPGLETLHSPSDPRVKLTETLHQSWVYSFRVNHGNRIAEAARLFRLTGEQRYADWSAAQLDFYADNFEKWPLQKRNSGIWYSVSRLFFQSLDEATNLTRHIEAARLLWDTVTPERRQHWGEKLFKPQAHMLNESFQSIHNIACWQRSAMGQVALVYNDTDLWNQTVDARFGIRNQLAEGATSDYFWYEQSLGYNDYVVSALSGVFLMAGLLGRMEELRHEMLIVENLMVAPLALRFPNGDLPSPADGSRRKAPTGRLFADTCRIFPTTIGREESAKSPGWAGLIDPQPESPGDKAGHEGAPLPAPISRNLESTRMALICRDGWQVYLHFGQLLQSHAQAEALNYEAWHGHTDITHDTATVGYGSPLHGKYYTRGLNHNVPLVGGEGQSGWSPGEMLEWKPDAGRVRVRQPTYRPGVQAARTLTVEGDRLTDVVLIELTDTALPDAPLGLTVHTQGKAVLTNDFAPAPNFAEGRQAGFHYWNSPMAVKAPANSVSLLLHYPEHSYRLTVQCSVPCRIFHGSTPDAPPNRRETVFLEAATPCRKATFTTIWEMARP